MFWRSLFCSQNDLREISKPPGDGAAAVVPFVGTNAAVMVAVVVVVVLVVVVVVVLVVVVVVVNAVVVAAVVVSILHVDFRNRTANAVLRMSTMMAT